MMFLNILNIISRLGTPQTAPSLPLSWAILRGFPSNQTTFDITIKSEVATEIEVCASMTARIERHSTFKSFTFSTENQELKKHPVYFEGVLGAGYIIANTPQRTDRHARESLVQLGRTENLQRLHWGGSGQPWLGPDQCHSRRLKNAWTEVSTEPHNFCKMNIGLLQESLLLHCDLHRHGDWPGTWHDWEKFKQLKIEVKT